MRWQSSWRGKKLVENKANEYVTLSAKAVLEDVDGTVNQDTENTL